MRQSREGSGTGIGISQVIAALSFALDMTEGQPRVTRRGRVRTLVVADMYEALAAKRPYRQDLSEGEVLSILQKDAGKGICPQVLDALKAFLAESRFVPYRVAA